MVLRRPPPGVQGNPLPDKFGPTMWLFLMFVLLGLLAHILSFTVKPKSESRERRKTVPKKPVPAQKHSNAQTLVAWAIGAWEFVVSVWSKPNNLRKILRLVAAICFVCSIVAPLLVFYFNLSVWYQFTSIILGLTVDQNYTYRMFRYHSRYYGALRFIVRYWSEIRRPIWSGSSSSCLIWG